MTFADGIAAVALGLGRAVVDGGKCLTFCPRYPRNLLQFSSVEDILANSQTEFWALELDGARRGTFRALARDALRSGCGREPTAHCELWLRPTPKTTTPSMME